MSVASLSSFAATGFAIALSAACTPVQVGAEAVDEIVAAIRAELAAEYEAKLEAAVSDIAQRYAPRLSAAAASAEDATVSRRRRRLAADTSFSGLAIKRDAAGVMLGVEGDVQLLRSGAEELSILADVDVIGGVNISGDLLVQDRDVLGELDTISSCSYANNAAARCQDASSEYKMSNCCDGGGWQLVYQLEVPDKVDYNVYADIKYKVDNSAKFTDGSFKRIAYHIQLDDVWVWASMDAPTAEADKIGLPIDWDLAFPAVTRLTLFTNAANLQSYNGITQSIGDIEFWSDCYGSAGALYDANEAAGGTEDCYGSFQLHTVDGNTIFAYNGWSNSATRVGDLGIGNNAKGTGKHPDWTFAQNANTYTVKTIRAYVSLDPGKWVPSDSCSYENDINARCKNATDTFKMFNCCDGGGWDLVYRHAIQNNANYDIESDVKYEVDNSKNFADGSFSRIGYHLQLDSVWVFVSMTSWTLSAAALQIPVDIVADFDIVSRLNIWSNSPSLVNYTGTSHNTGDIEFWSSCYGSVGNTHGDDSTAGTADCYGSFQVATDDHTNIFAYNAWSSTQVDDLGIGNYTKSVHTDWTFAANAASYTTKYLNIFVQRMPL